MPLGNPFVATTKGTHAFTERKVDIKADPVLLIAFFKALLQGLFPTLAGKSIHVPIGYRRVTGITGPGTLYLATKLDIISTF